MSSLSSLLLWLVVLIGWPLLLYVVVWLKGAPTYKFYCPACHKRYAHSLSKVLLGSGRAKCKKCSLEFEDGSLEWPELSPNQKLQHLFPPTVLVIVGCAVISAIAGTYITEPGDAVHSGFLGFSMFAFPLIPHFAARWWAIKKSKERFEHRELVGQGLRPDRS